MEIAAVEDVVKDVEAVADLPERMVQDKLAVRILDGSVLHGDHVMIDSDGKCGITFEVPKHVAA